jgi:TonB family protein
MRTIVIVFLLFIFKVGQSQNCTVEFLGDRAVISYETTLGKGSYADVFYKTTSSAHWTKALKVSGDEGLLGEAQKKYIVIWDYKTECKENQVNAVKVRIQNEAGQEDELSWQSNVPTSVNANSEKPKVFDFVQEVAEYPGGEIGMYNELRNYITYPEMEKQNQIQGTVFVSFIVEADGSISEIEVLRGVEEGPGFNKVAVRAIGSLKQRFKPAKMNGNPVRYRMRIPIKFSLTSESIFKKQ